MVHYDVMIVGGGTMGSAAAYFLSKQKLKVLVIDQFTIPNDRGSHHGHTRMLRLANGNGGRYVPLGIEALQLWRELEQETGKSLYKQTGALTVGFPGSEFVTETIESAVKFQMNHEVLSAAQIMERWPGISIPEDYYGCYDPEAGFLFSEEAIRTYKEQAIFYGATVLENEKVLEVNTVGDYCHVSTEKVVYQADKLIVTAGAWAKELLKPLDLPIQVIRKTIGWFKPNEEHIYSEDFPVFVFDTKNDGHYYGFPDFDGSGVKLGRMDLGYETKADTLDREFGTYEDDEGDLRRFLEIYMPSAAGQLLDGKVSMFSNTPDHDFIIDFHPEHSNIVFAAGFSGHGFKFASVIGSMLAEMIVEGKTSRDISFLRLKRFKTAVK